MLPGRSEGVCPRNGLSHSCACVRVAGVVGLLGSAGRLGFVVLLLLFCCRSPSWVAPWWRCFSGYVWGEGAYREMFSSARSTFWRAQNLPRQGFLQKRTHRATLKQESQVWSEARISAPGEYKNHEFAAPVHKSEVGFKGYFSRFISTLF